MKRVSDRFTVAFICSFTRWSDVMRPDVPARAGLLLGLAALGLGLAGAGAAIGVDSPVTDESPPGFTVTDSNVTLSDGGRKVTVINDTRSVDRIEISEEGSQFTVRTEQVPPLTEAERERAVAIVRGNGTLGERLAAMDGYDLDVEPIRRIAADQTTVRTLSSGQDDSGSFHVVTTENGTDSTAASVDSADSVVVARDPTYVEDRANVRVRPAEGDGARYSVTVDLVNGTVVRITDWSTVGDRVADE